MRDIALLVLLTWEDIILTKGILTPYSTNLPHHHPLHKFHALQQSATSPLRALFFTGTVTLFNNYTMSTIIYFRSHIG